MFRGFPGIHRFTEWQDVLQNVLVRLWRAIKELAPGSPAEFFALARVQVRRELLNLAGKYKNAPAAVDFNLDRSNQTLKFPGEDGFAAELDNWCHFHQFVAQLPAREREVVSLAYYHGWKQRQIADLLQLDVSTVRRDRRAALRKIKRRFHK
jgi:RNA polymerase sigma-70 factor (ECF subfamily)